MKENTFYITRKFHMVFHWHTLAKNDILCTQLRPTTISVISNIVPAPSMCVATGKVPEMKF